MGARTYLHNGSVPNLVDLLQPADKRPATFVVGYDVYDQQGVGFMSAGARRRRGAVRPRLPATAMADTSIRGCRKRTKELLEYLKTL